MPKAATAILLLLAACAPEPTEVTSPPIDEATRRETPLGAIVGFVDTYGAHTWLGIPYAAPPVGALRWREARPPAPWSETRTATEFGSACPQHGSPLGGAPPDRYGKPMGSEDCLYLNVYAPADALERAPLPVMVWIHGGGNVVGHAGFYEGGNLAATEHVVVVTMNYRLGPFGWFLHPSLANPAHPADGSGNYGTLDLVRALEWVRGNIAAFGGDAGNVTVFGESAGGTNIYSLLLSPHAEGLFHRAIIQSGGLDFASRAEAVNFTDDDVPGHAYSSNEMLIRHLVADGRASDRAAAKAVLADMSAGETAAYLRGKSTWEIFDAYLDGAGLLGPDHPREIQDGEVIPTGNPLVLLADAATYNAVPVIAGTNRDEPKIFMAFNDATVTQVLGIPLWPKDEQRYNLSARYGAMSWKYRGVDEPLNAMLDAGPPAEFAYRWDWDEEGTRLGFIDFSTLLGAAHGLEIPFVFGHFDLGPQSGSMFNEDNAPGRLALSRAMMAYWAEFARSGDPGTGGRDLPHWAPWGEARTLVLDTDAGGGIRMTDIEVSRDSIVAALAAETVDDELRCELFAETFRFDPDRGAVTAGWEQLGCNGLDFEALAAF